MGSYKVELLAEANRDLDGIFDYILLDNPDAAYHMLDKIFSSLEQLQDYPNLGVKLTDKLIRHYDFRMLIMDPYVAFYRVLENKVYVYRVLHGAQDYLSVLNQK
nr:type II toxin-antitoxin system RelE/ParE family toxin [Paenibacillus bovis]